MLATSKIFPDINKQQAEQVGRFPKYLRSRRLRL